MPLSLHPALRPPNWSSDDAAALRTFLESGPGSRLLFWLSLSSPAHRPVPGQTPDNALGECRGYARCMQSLKSLTDFDAAAVDMLARAHKQSDTYEEML
jgi:hypothetical protein